MSGEMNGESARTGISHSKTGHDRTVYPGGPRWAKRHWRSSPTMRSALSGRPVMARRRPGSSSRASSQLRGALRRAQRVSHREPHDRTHTCASTYNIQYTDFLRTVMYPGISRANSEEPRGWPKIHRR